MGTRHLYWILTDPSFAVQTENTYHQQLECQQQQRRQQQRKRRNSRNAIYIRRAALATAETPTVNNLMERKYM
jgi:hypothetical protein